MVRLVLTRAIEIQSGKNRSKFISYIIHNHEKGRSRAWEPWEKNSCQGVLSRVARCLASCLVQRANRYFYNCPAYDKPPRSQPWCETDTVLFYVGISTEHKNAVHRSLFCHAV